MNENENNKTETIHTPAAESAPGATSTFSSPADPNATRATPARAAPVDPNTTFARPPGASAAGGVTIPGYDLLPEIARGGMGVVYRARDLAFDREVAVKVMLPGMNGTEFVREARITGRLPHPGIPPVHALGELPDGRPFLAMKLIRGDTLDKVLKSRADLSADRGKLLAAFEQMCHAVGYAHAQGIIHRDLKPSNVMVGAFGEVQVMDWGLAKELRSGAHEASAPRTPTAADAAATVAGTVKGTPAYMAPEQARGEPVDARADVFALGGILAAVMTGRPPFVGNGVIDTVVRAARAELADIFGQLDASGADEELVALAKHCLAARADDRPRDGAAVAAAVAAHRAEIEDRLRWAERERSAERARLGEQRKRRRIQFLLTATVLLLVSVGSVGALVISLWGTAKAELEDAARRQSEADAVLEGVLKERNQFARDKASVLDQKNAADKAAAEAIAARQEALAARQEARQQRDRAEARANEAQRATGKQEWFKYADLIRAAEREHRTGNMVELRALLSTTEPQFRNWEWRYLDGRCEAPRTLASKNRMFGTDAHAAALSPNGWRVAVASSGVAWYGSITGPQWLYLRNQMGQISAVTFSADGAHIATAGSDGFVRVWGLGADKPKLALKGHDRAVASAAFSRDGSRIVTASDDGTAQVWNVGNETKPRPLNGHTGGVTAAAFSPDGSRVVTASADGTARVWNSDGKELFAFKRHTEAVTAVAFSPDGAHIVTGSTDKTTRVWEAADGKERLVLEGHTGRVSVVAYSPDGRKIVTVDGDGTARVWDTHRRADPLVLKKHTGATITAAFSRDGTHLLTLTRDGVTHEWNLAPKPTDLVLTGHTGGVNAAAFSPTGARAVTASDDGTARVWDTATGVQLLVFKGHTGPVTNVLFSPDGNCVFTLGSDGSTRSWDAATGTEVGIDQKPGWHLSRPIRSPDRARIVALDDDGKAWVQDAVTGANLFALKGHTGPIRSAAWSQDGTRIVTTSQDGTARIWDSGAEWRGTESGYPVAPMPRTK